MGRRPFNSTKWVPIVALAVVATACGASDNSAADAATGPGDPVAFCASFASDGSTLVDDAFEGEDLEYVLGVVDDLIAAAPPEIRPEMTQLGGFSADVAEALDALYSAEELDTGALDLALETLDDLDQRSAEINEASAVIRSWLADNCTA